MTTINYYRVLENLKMRVAKFGKITPRNYEEIPGLGTTEKPTKWLYCFDLRFYFIESGTHESGSHSRKSESEAGLLLSTNRSGMMITVAKLKGKDLIFPKILEGRDDLHHIEVESLKALSDQILSDSGVRIPVKELE
jgi:hypothetical protein